MANQTMHRTPRKRGGLHSGIVGAGSVIFYRWLDRDDEARVPN